MRELSSEQAPLRKESNYLPGGPRPQFSTVTEIDFVPCFRHMESSLEVIFISHGVLQLLRVVANQRTARVLDEIRPRFLCALPSCCWIGSSNLSPDVNLDLCNFLVI
jgi:hypothetical protein